jgi:murein DD-endopeptidase
VIASPAAWLALALLGAADSAPPAQGFELRVPHAPQPARIEDRLRLSYELHLTSFAAVPLAPIALSVRDAAGTRELARFDADALRRRSADVGAAQPADALAAGMRRVIYLEVDLARDALPTGLEHRLAYDDAGVAREVSGARVGIAPSAAATLGPPLRGGPWVAIHHADWPRGHRRVLYAIDGAVRIPGRHAIDFVRVDAAGAIARDEADLVANHLGYGAEVLAVADARVVAVRDTLPQSARVSTRVRHPLSEASGNYVALALGDGRHALYEHLKPGSVRVRAGQTVRRGEVLGALGFTGDSTGPHLHFHVADAAAPLGAEGLPFAFDGFELLGHYGDLSALGRARWQPRAASLDALRRDELPEQNSVLQFPADAARR